MPALRCHRRILRTAMLVLLVLGMVIKPTLGALSELHDVEHAVMALVDDGHSHAQAVDPGHGHADHEQGRGSSDPEHATGSHGLLHQGASASVALPAVVALLVRKGSFGSYVSEPRQLELPVKAPDLPFRPPIG